MLCIAPSGFDFAHSCFAQGDSDNNANAVILSVAKNLLTGTDDFILWGSL